MTVPKGGAENNGAKVLPEETEPLILAKEGSAVWKLCIDRPFLNCSRIFPTKQKYVRRLIDELSADEDVQRITVFGSAVTSGCNPWSDVDLFVQMKKEKPRPFLDVGTEVDYWTNYSVDERLYKEIMKKGVTVYEREDAEGYRAG